MREMMMRSMITVERLPNSHGSYLLGPDVSKMLGTIFGISEVSIESQFIDRATLSYQSSELDRSFDRIDELLATKGMRRVR
jgi:hypothetical protein